MSLADRKRIALAKRCDGDIRSRVGLVEVPEYMTLPYLPVVCDNQSLHGIEDDTIVKVWPARGIPNAYPCSDIILYGG